MADRPNQEEFIKAALDGDLAKVKALISAGVYINAIVCTRERETLLHRCMHTHIIKELVSRGARHWQNAYKEAPLNFAIKRGHSIGKIRALLKARPCDHSSDRHWNTPLNNALLRHDTEVVMELLIKNCEIELKVKDSHSRYNNPWDIMKCMDSLKLLIKCCIIYAVGNPHKQTYSIEDFRNTPNCRYNDLVDYGKECKAEIEKMRNDEIATNISLFNVVAKYPDDYFKRKSIAVRLTNRSDFEEIYPIYELIISDVILEPYVKRLHLFKKIDQSDIGLFPWRCIRDVLKNILEYLSNDDMENFISYACESPQCSASNLTETVTVSDVNEEPSCSNAKRPRLTYMGKPALYYATLSPPSRAVMLTAAALGVELELRPINLIKGEHLTPEFIKMNPQHTIPTLDDDGVIITDSHAICAYLVGKYSTDDKLYPKDLVKRANVDARLHLDSGHLFARLRMLYEPILYYGSTDCSIDKIAYIQKCWDILENFLKESPYLCGDELTIGDFCCVATVTSVNEVAPINETKYPKLTAWLQRLAELPYYKSVNEEGAEELKTLFKEKLAENKSKK